MIDEQIDEFLEDTWMTFEEKNKPISTLPLAKFKTKETKKILDASIKKDFLKIKNDVVIFTDKGLERARNIIRRHRLAERLFHDVLDIDTIEIEKPACKYEHILSREAADSICILLGHPRTCPHGMIIPSGECCLKKIKDVRPLVIPLSYLKAGETGVVAYMGTHNETRLSRLANLGIVPGNKITMKQKFPSLVIKLDETTLSIDDEIANDIFVKRPRRNKRKRMRRNR
ncbi:MAG: metal-dependent transcriptional regulator, partial [Actinomycetia bacterium]|nr:metal-dependent transcriptional regulator [Actinomycetes bacterium]